MVKLFYFDHPARAEVIRMMLRAAKLKFEDIRFSRTEWAELYKSKSPTGHCPFLELDDGQVLAEKMAIELYVARITGYLPSDTLAQAKAVMICGVLADMWQTLYPSFAMTDVVERLAERTKLLAEGGATAQKLAAVEKLLKSRATEFAVSDEPSLADFDIFSTVSNFRAGYMDGLTEESLAPYPCIMGIWTKVAKLPGIAEQFASHGGVKAYEGYKP